MASQSSGKPFEALPLLSREKECLTRIISASSVVILPLRFQDIARMQDAMTPSLASGR